MFAELAGMLAHRAHLAVERRCDFDEVVVVVTHDQGNFGDAVRDEARRAVGRVLERPGCPEVARLHPGQPHGPVIGRLPVARRPAVRVVGDDRVRALLADEPGRRLGELRTGPGKLAVREVEEGQPRHAADRSRRPLLHLAQSSHPLGPHCGIVVPLVASREDRRMHVVPLIDPSGHRGQQQDDYRVEELKRSVGSTNRSCRHRDRDLPSDMAGAIVTPDGLTSCGGAPPMPNHDSLQLRNAVHTAYSAAAERPAQKHAFPVGRVLAERLGYPADLLDTVPLVAVEAFAGVSTLAVSAPIPANAHVLDLGCGAGLDSLILARRVGPTGRVVGVDFSEAMLTRARQAAGEAGVDVTFHQGDAERLPLDEASVDAALVNGIFNLNPARAEIFRELARVVRPGGHVYVAELILQEVVTKPDHFTEAEWFA